MISSTSGPGFTRTSYDGASGAGFPLAAGGAGALSGLSSFLDPALLREAMLQGLNQRAQGFAEWQANQEQQRKIAAAQEGRAATESAYSLSQRQKADREAARKRYELAPLERTAAANAQARDVAQTQAITGRAPQRRVSFIGSPAFDTTDPLAMTGAQRQAFLPGGNELSSVPTRQDLEGLSSDAAFNAMLGEDRSRQRYDRYGSNSRSTPYPTKKKKAPAPSDNDGDE